MKEQPLSNRLLFSNSLVDKYNEIEIWAVYLCHIRSDFTARTIRFYQF